MFEFLAARRQQIEFLTLALREDGMAGVAVAGLDAALAIAAVTLGAFQILSKAEQFLAWATSR